MNNRTNLLTYNTNPRPQKSCAFKKPTCSSPVHIELKRQSVYLQNQVGFHSPKCQYICPYAVAQLIRDMGE